MKQSAIKGLITKLNKKLKALKSDEVLIKKNLNAEVYHGCNGISNSSLKVFMDCPAKFYARYIAKTNIQKTTEAFDIGKAIHCAVLEPHLFHTEFVTMPKSIKAKRGKEWIAFAEENADKVILTLDQNTDVKGIFKSVMNNLFAKKIFTDRKSVV